MSLAKIQHVKSARKAQGKCEVDGTEINPGDPYKHYSVGFRGRKRVRCVTCPDPRPSERESSLLADVYAAQESADVESITTTADAVEVIAEFSEAVREVAEQYQAAAEAAPGLGAESEERAEALRSSAAAVENDFSPDTYLIRYDANGDDSGQTYAEDEALPAAVLDDLRQTVREAIDQIELP